MRNLHNSINDSWDNNNFLYNFLYDLNSWNFDDAVHYLLSENFHYFRNNSVYVNWYWLSNINRNVLDVTNDNWLLYNKFDWCEVLNENRNLSILNYKFLLYSSQRYNFFNYDSLFFNDLLENWDLRMAWNLYYFLFNWTLHEVTFFNNNFFWILFIYCLFDLNYHSLWFLAITVLRIIYWFLDHHLDYLGELMSFNDCFLFFNKLNLFLSNDVMNGSINDFIFLFSVHFRHSLFNFEHSVNFFVNVLWHLFFHFNLFYFHNLYRIRHFDLLVEFLCLEYSFCKVNWDFSNKFNVSLFCNRNLNKTHLLYLLDNFFSYSCRYWDQSLYSRGNL